MFSILKSFFLEESGQDLIEYTLLLAFVALVSAAIFITAGQSAAGVWTVANQQLSNANAAVS